jgi:hypothetical protein
MAANIIVFIQFYPEKDEDRLEEIKTCVLNNLNNPHVRTVMNLRESPDDEIPEEFVSHPKWKEYPLHKRVMFQDVFEIANKVASQYQRCCFMNLDIMLDDDSPWNEYTGDNNIVLLRFEREHETLQGVFIGENGVFYGTGCVDVDITCEKTGANRVFSWLPRV